MQIRWYAARSITAFLLVGLTTASIGLAQRGPQPTTPKEDDVKKVEAALPDSAPAKPAKARKVLIFGRAVGYVHSSIPLGCKTVELLGKKTGAYDSVISFDPTVFDKSLDEFDGLVLVSTTGDFMDDRSDKEKSAKRREALRSFVEGGKGVVGIHAACDAYYLWPQYGQILGGYFSQHQKQNEPVSIVNEDPKNPINAALDGKGLEFADEIYRFLPDQVNWGRGPQGAKQAYDRSKLHILLSVDSTKHHNPPEGADMPVAWCHEVGKGREFYCSLGHNEYVYYNPTVQKYYLAGIQYALGDLKADDKPGEKTAAK
jgi:uncharacterized protein